MKTAFRSLFVWLLLLALPWQGVAAARMLPAVAAGGHARAMLAPMHATATTTTATAADGQCALHAAMATSTAQKAMHDGQAGHGGGSCASCCIAIALAPTPGVPPAPAPPDFIAIPFRAGHVTSADPSLPERPPRPLSA